MATGKTDWRFPLEIDSENGKIKMNSLESDIAQSLFLLLSTKKGERLNRPDYGCSLTQFAFENIGYTLISRIREEIANAIRTYEPRVTNVEITVIEGNSASNDTENLVISISYTIKKTSERQTLNYNLDKAF